VDVDIITERMKLGTLGGGGDGDSDSAGRHCMSFEAMFWIAELGDKFVDGAFGHAIVSLVA